MFEPDQCERCGAYHQGIETCSPQTESKTTTERHMTTDKLIEEIQLKLQSTGGEPEYLEIRTPISDDNLGWFALIHWMHHDGTIPDSPAFRHKFIHGVLQLVLDYLIERETVTGVLQ